MPARPLPKRAGELIGARGTASERDLNGETRPDTPARAHAGARTRASLWGLSGHRLVPGHRLGGQRHGRALPRGTSSARMATSPADTTPPTPPPRIAPLTQPHPTIFV